MYLTNNDRENVKSRFSFLLSSITWIIIESLKLALSIFDSKFEVCYAAAAEAPGPGAVVDAGLLLVVADMVPPVFAISRFK